MRPILKFSFVFFLVFFYGLILSQVRINVQSEELEPKNHPGFYDYRGVTNVYTDRSLGSGTPTEVIKAAEESGLDFLFLTDLNIFSKNPTLDGYHRKLLVLNAAQYSYLESRLFLYDVKRRHEIDGLGQTQTLLADLLSQSGADEKQDLLILAHPTRPGYTWNGNYPSGLDGIEVINLKSVWEEAWERSKISFAWSAIVYPFNSHLALIRLYDEPESELRLWNQLTATRPTIGIAGADARAKTNPVAGFFIRFPTYQTLFSLASNHLLLRSELTGDVESDRKKVLSALSGGEFYFSIDALGNPKGFVAFAQHGEHVFPMGSEIKYAPGLKINVHLPRKPKVPFEAAFLKDGQHIMSSNSADTEFEVHGPGVYRIIVRVFLGLTLPDGNRWFTWIYANPFYVR